MSQQGPIAPQQDTRLVAATRRQAMAQEKVRILGRSRPPPSALEVAAAQWEEERRASARTQEARLRMSRQAETYPFFVRQVSLQTDSIAVAEEAGWKASPPRKAKPRPRRLGGIAVGSFAIRLIQRERAGGGGWKAIGPRAQALEEAARRWEQQQAARNLRRQWHGNSSVYID